MGLVGITALAILVSGAPAGAAASGGSAVAWGDGEAGALGTGHTTNSSVPVPVRSLTHVKAVAGGAGTGYALRTDGTVWAWGSGARGALGNGHTRMSTVPVRVSGLTHVTAIAASGHHAAFALRSDGTVWSWGDNTDGLLGNGNFASPRSVPAKIPGLARVTTIGAGYDDGYAVAGGRVFAWGNKSNGALGAGDTGNNNGGRPVQLTGLSGVVSVAGGYFSGMALTTSGNVWIWGRGARLAGQPNDRGFRPVHAKALSHVKAIAAGGVTWFALLANGTVRSWGAGLDGVLGNGQTPFDVPFTHPVRVYGLTHVKAIAASGQNAYALRTDGTAWSWGSGRFGALGSGSNANRSVPGRVLHLNHLSAIGAGLHVGYAIQAR